MFPTVAAGLPQASGRTHFDLKQFDRRNTLFKLIIDIDASRDLARFGVEEARWKIGLPADAASPE
jgi:hypothetical protein